MLLGEFRCRADGEGRLVIPAGFREELAGGATVTRGIERCLMIYPADEWDKLADRLQRALPLTSAPARDFARFMFSGAAQCVLDAAGHISLPDRLLGYAAIDEEAVAIGLLSHLEIWSPAHWVQSRASFIDEAPALAESLRQFGI